MLLCRGLLALVSCVFVVPFPPQAERESSKNIDIEDKSLFMVQHIKSMLSIFTYKSSYKELKGDDLLMDIFIREQYPEYLV